MNAARPKTSLVFASLLFFALALAFFVIGLIAFGWSWAVSGAWNPAHPLFLAGVHAFLVGGLSSIYFGALYQLVPVVSERHSAGAGGVALFHLGIHTLATATLVGGFGAANYRLVAWGGGLFAVGLVVLVAISLWQLERRRSWEPESIGVFLGLGWSLLVVTVGLWMALFRAGLLPSSLSLEALRGVHLRVALAGWLLNLLLGLSHRLIPMFLVARRSGRRFARMALFSLNGGLLISALGIVGDLSTWVEFGDGLMGLALLFHLGATLVQFRSRLRPLGGAFVSYLWGTFGLLSCAVVWLAERYWAQDQSHSSPGEWAIVAAVLPVALLPIVFAVSARIIPFLVWQAHCAPWIGKRKLPSVASLWSERLLWIECGILVGLGVTAGLALIWPRGIPLSIAGLLFFALLGVRLSNCRLLRRRIIEFNHAAS